MAIPPDQDTLRRDTEVQLQVEVLDDRITNVGPAFTQHTTYRVLHAWPHNGFATPAVGTEVSLICTWYEEEPELEPGQEMPDWAHAYRQWRPMKAGTVLEGFFCRDSHDGEMRYEVVEGCLTTVNHARAEPWFTMPPPRVPKPVAPTPPAPVRKRAPKNWPKTWIERWFGVWS